jgi:hypothetical protein
VVIKEGVKESSEKRSKRQLFPTAISNKKNKLVSNPSFYFSSWARNTRVTNKQKLNKIVVRSTLGRRHFLLILLLYKKKKKKTGKRGKRLQVFRIGPKYKRGCLFGDIGLQLRYKSFLSEHDSWQVTSMQKALLVGAKMACELTKRWSGWSSAWNPQMKANKWISYQARHLRLDNIKSVPALAKL